MAKSNEGFAERRRYIRLEEPIGVRYTMSGGRHVTELRTKNISADGLRFETHDRQLKVSDTVELKLDIPGASNPVHAGGTVVWKRKMSLEDHAPFDVGMEISKIDEDNKNTFLKFFCDLIYRLKQ